MNCGACRRPGATEAEPASARRRSTERSAPFGAISITSHSKLTGDGKTVRSIMIMAGRCASRNSGPAMEQKARHNANCTTVVLPAPIPAFMAAAMSIEDAVTRT